MALAVTGQTQGAAASVATVPAPRTATLDWRRNLARRIWVSDLLIIIIAVTGAQLFRFESFGTSIAISPDSALGTFSYTAMSAVLVIAWMWLLALSDSRSSRIVGSGTLEYRRVADASLRVFGAVAIIAFLLRVDLARGYLLVSLPLGLALLECSRWLWRQWLVRQRRHGRYTARLLLVGSESSVADLAQALIRSPDAGYSLVGACLADGTARGRIVGTDVPVLGTVDDIESAMATTGADTVAIASADHLGATKVKQISWGLEAGHQHLVLAPSIIDVAGPRIHAVPVAGLPLIHVEIPRLSAGQRLVKRMADLLMSLVGIVLLLPLAFVLAVLVRASGPGPILFSQVRVGLHGRSFRMLKFRTMVADAEDQLPSLRDIDRDTGNEVLFKLRDDPRVTVVGRFMRRYSLDELPQLLNVIAGDMSLVGPRPHLKSEVDQYDDHVHRRFLMKPGITGIWQVSGRSALSWEDSVRLDLSYIENYSLVSDLVILLKTVKAVLRPGETAF